MNNTMIAKKADWKPVAWVDKRRPGWRANAQLILRAPELLVAAEYALEFLRKEAPNHASTVLLNYQVAQVRGNFLGRDDL